MLTRSQFLTPVTTETHMFSTWFGIDPSACIGWGRLRGRLFHLKRYHPCWKTVVIQSTISVNLLTPTNIGDMMNSAPRSPTRPESGATTIGRLPAMLFNMNKNKAVVIPWISTGVISAMTVYIMANQLSAEIIIASTVDINSSEVSLRQTRTFA